MTQRLDVHPTHPQARLLKCAAGAHQGELIAYPSDTTYVLACHVGDKAAMEPTAAAAGKESSVHLACRDLSELSTYARVENADYRLLKRNTPGPFTYIACQQGSAKTLSAPEEADDRPAHSRSPGCPGTIGSAGGADAHQYPALTWRCNVFAKGDEIVARLKSQIAVVLDSGACGIGPPQ